VLRLPVFIIYKRINITAKGEQTYLLEQIDELLLADTSPELATLYHSQEDRLDLIRPRGRYERNTGHCGCVSHSPHKIRQDNWTYNVHEQQVRELSRGGPVSSAPPLASSRPLRYWLRSGHFHLCLIAATGSDVRHEGQRVQDQPWLYCVGGDRGTAELASHEIRAWEEKGTSPRCRCFLPFPFFYFYNLCRHLRRVHHVLCQASFISSCIRSSCGSITPSKVLRPYRRTGRVLER
jgi:hypothetical protein